MRIVDRYLGREVIVSALFAVGTLTLVLVLGRILQRLFAYVIDHNVPVTYIITFIAYFLPVSLTLSIPWGFLTAVLLVFGRLSAGNELTALRTAGVSIPRIALPVLVLAVVCSGICLWINLYVAPRAQENLKEAFFQVATQNPAAAFTGETVINDFPNKKIYIGGKEGDQLRDVHVFDLDENNKPIHVVVAETGNLETDLEHKQIVMRLEGSRLERRDPLAPDDLTKVRDGFLVGEYSFPISLEELFTKKAGRRKPEAYSFQELRDELASRRRELAANRLALKGTHDPQLSATVRANLSQVAAAATELNKRFSYSLACVTFALIGIPLGITAQRQETSAGFALSLLVALSYFLIFIVVNAFREKARVHPEVLIWVPNAIFLLLGGVLFFRLSRR